MKTIVITLTLLAGIAGAMAQSPATDETFKSEGKYRKDQSLIAPSKSSDSQIRGKNVTYTGIAVQAVKTRNPLQLLNPFAPQAQSSSTNNAVRDPKNGRVVGLKLFAIQF